MTRMNAWLKDPNNGLISAFVCSHDRVSVDLFGHKAAYAYALRGTARAGIVYWPRR